MVSLDAFLPLYRSFVAWSLKDAVREVEQSYPYLSTFNSGPAYQLRLRLSNLPIDEQVRRLQILVKRGLDEEYPALNFPPLSDNEQLWVNECLTFCALPSPEDYEFYMAERHGTLRAWDRRAFIKLLCAKLDPIFKAKCQNWGGGTFCYEIGVGNLVLRTFLDVGGRGNRFMYDHSLSMPNGVEVLRTSLLRWLGISQTDWFNMNSSMNETLPDIVSALCEKFVRALPSILEAC